MTSAWRRTRWCGHKIEQIPNDIVFLQEVVCRDKPDFVIETGTRFGGSALFYGSILECLGHGELISVDNNPRAIRPSHPRVRYITGDSGSPSIASDIRNIVRGHKTLLILDSDHSQEHVTKELELLSPLVTPGCHMIVQDTELDGPRLALEEFLKDNDEWFTDPDEGKFGVTKHPGGWLIKDTKDD